MPADALPRTPDDTGEDLLGLWSDLEAGLSVLLSRAHEVPDFSHKVLQYDRWMQDLVRHDTDTALYLLFQLATTSVVGYSASHALVCAALCHIVADGLGLPREERDALVRAALTMNIAMTQLQDRLATQQERPSAEQRTVIEQHARESAHLLATLGVSDAAWLDVVRLHHVQRTGTDRIEDLAVADRLAHVLCTIDRYAAMISPRSTRAGRSADESVKTILAGRTGDEVGYALLRVVGLCPPGTFVELDSGEVAVVVRRSKLPNQPVVAIVADPQRRPLRYPRLHRVYAAPPRVRAALSHDRVALPVSYRTLLRVGIESARALAAEAARRAFV